MLGRKVCRYRLDVLEEHPQAHLVPQMRPEELELLREDIRANGVQTPLHVVPVRKDEHGFHVVDGRHRLRVVRDLVVDGELEDDHLPCVEVDLEGESPVAYMIRSATLRRHLNEAQLAGLAVQLQEALSTEAQSEKGRKAGLASAQARADMSGDVPDVSGEPDWEGLERRAGEDQAPPRGHDEDAAMHREETGDPWQDFPPPAPSKRDTRREAAQAVGLPPESRKVRDMARLKREAPEQFEQVMAGQATLQEARRELRRAEREQQLEEMEAAAAEVRASEEPLGRFLCCSSSLQVDAQGRVPAAMQGHEFDLILTDPPYGRTRSKIAHTERSDIDSNFGEWDAWEMDWVHDLPWWLDDHTGQALIFCPVEGVGLLEKALQEAGMHYRGAILWHKSNPAPQHRPGYISSVEAVVWATMGTGYHFTPWENAGALEAHNFVEGPTCGGSERLDHPTQKPLWLLRRLLERHARPGQRVLDLFAGVGSHLVAAEQYGCRYLGFELDACYHRQGMARLHRVQVGSDAAAEETPPYNLHPHWDGLKVVGDLSLQEVPGCSYGNCEQPGTFRPKSSDRHYCKTHIPGGARQVLKVVVAPQVDHVAEVHPEDGEQLELAAEEPSWADVEQLAAQKDCELKLFRRDGEVTHVEVYRAQGFAGCPTASFFITPSEALSLLEQLPDRVEDGEQLELVAESVGLLERLEARAAALGGSVELRLESSDWWVETLATGFDGGTFGCAAANLHEVAAILDRAEAARAGWLAELPEPVRQHLHEAAGDPEPPLIGTSPGQEEAWRGRYLDRCLRLILGLAALGMVKTAAIKLAAVASGNTQGVVREWWDHLERSGRLVKQGGRWAAVPAELATPLSVRAGEVPVGR